MSGPNGQGRSMLANLLSWLVVLAIGSIVLQILLSEFVRWVTILAPWMLAALLVVAFGLVVMSIARRRLYNY